MFNSPSLIKYLAGKVTIRVFAIIQKPVEANLTVIDQISFLNTLIYILIYCGVAHCFIAKSLVIKLGVQQVKVTKRVKIELLDEGDYNQ